jgi:hypothetical protein
MDLLDGDVELTEFEAIDAQSVKGVRHGANGFPFLLVKGLAPADGDVAKAGDGDAGDDDARKSALGIAVKAVTGGVIDQAPDIALGHQIMSLLAQAIQQEAQEIAAGSYGETCDVDLLNCAASMISRWVGREAAPGEDDGMMLMQSAAKAVEWTDEQWAEWVAALQKAIPGARLLPPGSKDDDAAKGQIAKGDATVDTDVQGTGDLAKVVEDAVTKALQPHKERVTALEAELAKVRAAPVPGGPVLSRNVQVKTPQGAVSEDWAAKAAYYREMAEQVTDRPTADGYRKLARDADAKAVTPPAT